MKIHRNLFIITIPAVFILLCFLELFFRTVIPACELPEYIFDENEKMFCSSNSRQSGLYTLGKFAQVRAKWRINNMNWNYPIDYGPVHTDKKLIAVIGDSFVEAFQVDTDKKYPYLLREKLKPDTEIFAFATSGFPLSQYLHVSRYVKEHFDPDILIFNVVHNDFNESVYELRPDKYAFLQLSMNDDGSIRETVPRSDYSRLKRIVAGSALLRYLLWNLHLALVPGDIMSSYKNIVANIDSDEVQENKDIIIRATDYLVKTIKNENSKKRIIFIMDAPRSAIYRNESDTSVSWMNKMMREICAAYKIEYIDLTPLMRKDYEMNHKKFNSELDNHWNEYGHIFVANVLYDHLSGHPIQ